MKEKIKFYLFIIVMVSLSVVAFELKTVLLILSILAFLTAIIVSVIKMGPPPIKLILKEVKEDYIHEFKKRLHKYLEIEEPVKKSRKRKVIRKTKSNNIKSNKVKSKRKSK